MCIRDRFSPLKNQIIEIGAVRVEKGKVTDRFSTFINPQVPIPFKIEQLTGIDDTMVLDAPLLSQALPDFIRFCEGAVMVAHNANFDMGFVSHYARQLGMAFEPTYVDTVGMALSLIHI